MKSKHRKSKRRAVRRGLRAVQGGLSRLRKQIVSPAPPATTEASSAKASPAEAGILRPGTGSLRLPHALAEAGEAEPEETAHSWMPGPVVLSITACALLIIAILTWLISRMPDRP
jgi:hypothetical protein